MKKLLTIFCLLASLFIILDTMNFLGILVIFLFAGIIPGTNITLSAVQMMLLMAALTGVLIGSISLHPMMSKLKFISNKQTY